MQKLPAVQERFIPDLYLHLHKKIFICNVVVMHEVREYPVFTEESCL